jgi:LmbE family N-acetylglucosaminyl deacetylase
VNNSTTALRLMIVLAHADEEGLLVDATLARYAAEGAEMTLVVATGGQRSVGTAFSRLGLREVVPLGYPDGELDQAEPDQVICELVGHIRRVQPHVVITSGPGDGRTTADGLAISQFATAAVMRASDPRYGHACSARRPHAVSKLYYSAVGAPVTTRIEASGQTHCDAFYRAFSTVNGGQALETDLFEGLREPARHVGVAA